jgi:hypothetical protein
MIVEAGFVSFFRTLLIIILLYYGFRFLVKLLFPIVIKKYAEKQHSAFSGNRTSTSSSSPNEKKKRSSGDKLGEYVDYEEVE